MAEFATRLWVVGKLVPGEMWEFVGLFDEEAAAVGACRSEAYFVAPVDLNVPAPEDQRVWPGAYYPLAAADCGPLGADDL